MFIIKVLQNLFYHSSCSVNGKTLILFIYGMLYPVIHNPFLFIKGHLWLQSAMKIIPLHECHNSPPPLWFNRWLTCLAINQDWSNGVLGAVLMWDILQELIFNSIRVKSHLPVNYLSFNWSFWNFAQSTVIIMPSSMQNFKMIWQVNWMF